MEEATVIRLGGKKAAMRRFDRLVRHDVMSGVVREVASDWVDDILVRLGRPPRCGYRWAAGVNCRRRGTVRTWMESGWGGGWLPTRAPATHCREHADRFARDMVANASFGPWRVRGTEVWPWK